MRRIQPAYPDLFPVSHVARPGYLPGGRVTLDPLRMAIVWENSPRRTLPRDTSVPKEPVRAIAFARVVAGRPDVLPRLCEGGSSTLVVLDDPSLTPDVLGLGCLDAKGLVTILVPVLPGPLADRTALPTGWIGWRWGGVLGLFPFPGAGQELEDNIGRLYRAGAAFAVCAPLLLTPKDRHRIVDAREGSDDEEQLENCLFHADPSRGLQALERRAGIAIHRAGMEPIVAGLAHHGLDPDAVRTSAFLRLWARRLDQSQEESSWGWRLRRAASALDRLPRSPRLLAAEDNLRVVPGFDPWVESFTRALWDGGEPLDSAWRRWAELEVDDG